MSWFRKKLAPPAPPEAKPPYVRAQVHAEPLNDSIKNVYHLMQQLNKIFQSEQPNLQAAQILATAAIAMSIQSLAHATLIAAGGVQLVETKPQPKPEEKPSEPSGT